MRRFLSILLALAMLSGSALSALAASEAQAPAEPAENCTYFEETGHSLCFGFRDYWNAYGGLAVFGFPITEEFVQDGVTTQYFERARFEWHPGAWPERFDVLLGLLGVEAAERQGLSTTEPFTAVGECGDRTDCLEFAETGHTLAAGFLSYWEAYGGLAIFGYPISEEFDAGDARVQYFERAVFEWRPGSWPERFDVQLGLVGVDAMAGDEEPEPVPPFEVVAEGLNNPRGLAFDADGALYIAEAGAGGEGPCLPNPENPDDEICYGPSGSITRVADGVQERIVEALPSLAAEDGSGATGVTGVWVDENGRVSFIVGLGADPAARANFDEAGDGFGWLYTLDADGTLTKVADVAAYETDANPAGGPVDSNPYAVIDQGDGWVVVDAGGNDLLGVDAEGTVSTIAVFPPIMIPVEQLPPFLAEQLPPEMTEFPVESVPTDVVQDSDGTLYISELTGFPFPKGAARIWRMAPGEEPAVFAEGFTNLISLAIGPDGTLYALEMAQDGLASGGPPMGALYRIDADGTKTVLMDEGLFAPTGLAVDADGAIYISVNGILAGAGMVIKITP